MSFEWLEQVGEEREIAVSTRARLARNLAEFPFPHRASVTERKRVAQLVREAAKAGELAQLKPYELEKLEKNQRLALVAAQRISPQMADGTPGRWALLAADGSFSILVNEEDHLRLQALAPGCEPQKVFERVSAAERLLARGLELAWDDRLGFLTTSLANVGTGLRLSVLLHLPALTLLKELEPQKEAVCLLGGTIRGVHGEGSLPTGALYQISHEITYRPENDPLLFVRSVQGAAQVLIAAEQSARERLLVRHPYSLRTSWEQAAARIREADLLEESEALELLSNRRLSGVLALTEPLAPTEFAEALLELGKGSGSRLGLARAALLRRYLPLSLR
ncbi:hypothetical protein [Armatimonas sp.]|uniref:hypothetical protein n=1 Tax=Armatimonas sp. TaxID=1872638 RepID=UPI00286A3413|nr:hypothetical protein [Armatimonas sp.]